MGTLTFSPSEASAITGLPLKVIHKAIDTEAIPKVSTEGRKRYFSARGLVCLQLHSKGLGELPLGLRTAIFREVCRQPRARRIRCGDAMIIELQAARTEVAVGLARLRRAEQIVDCNPNILGGTPVFKGTRVPVHLIAEMAESRIAVSEILENYPSITEEQVSLSIVYAKAYPKRGRPPVQPWKKKNISRRTRTALKPCRLEVSNG